MLTLGCAKRWQRRQTRRHRLLERSSTSGRQPDGCQGRISLPPDVKASWQLETGFDARDLGTTCSQRGRAAMERPRAGR